jgi:hypothetical protein
MAGSLASNPERRRLIRILGWVVFLGAVAIAFRYLVIELRPVAELCESTGAPWWCDIRETIIRVFYSDSIGILSFGMAIVAVLLGSRPSGRLWAIAAVTFAAPSIVLYSADYAAPGLLLGLVMLVRGLLRSPGALPNSAGAREGQ